jgi:hypothetical protein
VIPSVARERLLRAAPSFASVWEASLADGLRDQALERVTHELVTSLGRHLGTQLIAGDQREAEWLFAELEAQFEFGDDEHDVALRIGLLESLAHTLVDADRPLTLVESLLTGPASRAAWGVVVSWVGSPRSGAREG